MLLLLSLLASTCWQCLEAEVVCSPQNTHTALDWATLSSFFNGEESGCVDVTGAGVIDFQAMLVVKDNKGWKVFAKDHSTVFDAGGTFRDSWDWLRRTDHWNMYRGDKFLSQTRFSNRYNASHYSNSPFFTVWGELHLENVTLRNAILSGAHVSSILVRPTGRITAVRTIFFENTAVRGAVVLNSKHDSGNRFLDCTFRKNSAYGRGGSAVTLQFGLATFERCRFIENMAFGPSGVVEMKGFSNATFRECFFDNDGIDLANTVNPDQPDKAELYGTQFQQLNWKSGNEGVEKELKCGSSCSDPDDISQNCVLKDSACYSCHPCGHCSRGMFRSSSSEPFSVVDHCKVCPAGRYQPSSTEALFCKECEAGKYVFDDGISAENHYSCMGCPNGYNSTRGSRCCRGHGVAREKLCAICDQGKFEKNSKCIACPAGRYSGTLGQTVCSECPVGSFIEDDGQDWMKHTAEYLCTLCQAGRASHHTGASACQVCGAGFYSGGMGKSECLECSLGSISTSARLYCSQCPAGRAANSQATECIPCPEGTHTNSESGAASCMNCLPGKYAEGGSISCATCPAGTSALEKSASCTSCSFGEYSDEGSNQCTMCQKGRVADEGNTQCIACLAGKFADKGINRCTDCELFKSSGMEASNCTLDHWLLILAMCCFVTQFFATYTLIRFFRLPIRIVDVSRSGDMVVITTFQSHRIHHHMLFRHIEAYISDTKNPFLDDAEHRFCLRSLDRNRLELLDENANPFQGPCDASSGILILSPIHELLCVAWGRIPRILLLFPLPWLITLVSFRDFSQSINVFVVAIASAFVLAAIIGTLSRRRYMTSQTPLQIRHRNYTKKLLKKVPKPQKCAPGPDRAVTLEQVQDLLNFFRDFIRDRTAYYLDSNVLRPITRQYQLSFAEVAGPSRLLYFVSHFWGTGFEHFVESLQEHAKTLLSDSRAADAGKVAYWICFLSNNQWNLEEEELGNWKKSSFYKALWSGSCCGTCMVLDKDALPLTRAWCLFEVLQSFLLEQDEEAGKNFQGLLYCTDRGVMGYDNHQPGSKTCFDVALALSERLAKLNVAEAQASMKSDLYMIKLLIEQEGGMQKMNHFIRDNMARALLKVEMDFGQRMQESKSRLIADEFLVAIEDDERHEAIEDDERHDRTIVWI